ncbi:MAG: hypothetical protein OHK0029_29300 [Armatimonadaceae bacterium]
MRGQEYLSFINMMKKSRPGRNTASEDLDLIIQALKKQPEAGLDKDKYYSFRFLMVSGMLMESNPTPAQKDEIIRLTKQYYNYPEYRYSGTAGGEVKMVAFSIMNHFKSKELVAEASALTQGVPSPLRDTAMKYLENARSF